MRGASVERLTTLWIAQLLFLHPLPPPPYSMSSVGFSHDALPSLPSEELTVYHSMFYRENINNVTVVNLLTYLQVG